MPTWVKVATDAWTSAALSVELWRYFNATFSPKLIAFQSSLPRRTGREKDRSSLHPWIHFGTCGG
jgi:hypothetical protein